MKRIIILQRGPQLVHVIWQTQEDTVKLVDDFCAKKNIDPADIDWIANWDGKLTRHPLALVPPRGANSVEVNEQDEG